ncbi:hypothetical protein HPB49_004699 [Dermacentor silvarum]|uniref:Uncharacterized protein n=1 Tax=Dermacentor silvarum TaxID=543639 RepID=A0ACB8DU70_DERSI|nr:hypothetical protein HPB49_004699 [Dermacentor silvarum]
MTGLLVKLFGEATYGIPITGFEEGTTDYRSVVRDLMAYLRLPIDEANLPPLFCMQDHIPLAACILAACCCSKNMGEAEVERNLGTGGVAVKTVFRIIYEKLHIAKASARWVPRILSSVQKEHRVTCSRKLLELCNGNEKKVLESIVTGDETMVLYYDPLSKRESMEWRKPEEVTL